MSDFTTTNAMQSTISRALFAEDNCAADYAWERALDLAFDAYWENRKPQVPAIGTLRTVAYYNQSGDWFGSETLRVVSTAHYHTGDTMVTCERLHPYDHSHNGTTVFPDLTSFWALTI